ncbi:MAG: NAD(P)/FAD-dependent oxidoreductase [Candidatus Aminicenantes bacterium]|nr:NAD(P)/FAD-dependent oxidoreductase [Candidatus Aminicenantes bacterium]
MNLEIAVIGAGPAGIAAAVQLKRFDLEHHVFEKNRIGGLLWNAHRVENYPAFPDGIPGAQLAALFENHLENFHIPVIPDAVISLDFHTGQDRFLLSTAAGTFTANFVIVASGTEPKTRGILGLIPGELERYVVFEIFPLLGLTGKNIVIVGAGDIALDYALHLSEFQGNNITLVYRSEKINALPLLVRRVRATPAVTMMSSAALKKVEKGDGYPLNLTFESLAKIATKPLNKSFVGSRGGFSKEPLGAVALDADILVGAIGRDPQTGFFTRRLHEMEKQLIDKGRLHMVGDVKNGRLRQAVIAAGSGVEAAMKIAAKVLAGHHEEAP